MTAQLSAVTPEPRLLTPSPPQANTLRQSSGSLNAWAKKTSDAWFAVQITHYGGKYSIERMLALEEYTRKTSLLRVLLVIIATPLPVVILVLCQESVPLQSPTEGWSANWGFWIRMGIVGIGEGFGTAFQTGYLLDDVSLSLRQMILISICVGVGQTVVAILVAEYWTFPVPFINFTLSMVLFTIFLATLGVVVGGQVCRKILSKRKQLKQWVSFFTVVMIMVFVYQAFQVLFNFVNRTSYELPVLLLLPIMKILLKNIFTFTIMHKEDTIPEQVIFTVDFFDALYLAMCMQSVSSTTAVVVVMATDIFQNAIDLYELNQRTRDILARLRKPAGSKDGAGKILVLVRSLCDQSKTLKSQLPADIQVRSCIFHEVSSEGRDLIEKFSGSSQIGSTRTSLRLSQSLVSSLVTVPERLSMIKSMFRCCNSIAPKDTPVAKTAVCNKQLDSKTMRPDQSTIDDFSTLHDVLEVLFTAECLVLTEFLETVVPFYYAQFVLIMVHLPSAQYRKELDGVNPENVGSMVQNILIYALLELISFVVLAIIMQQNCGIQALYQLAFVFETQMSFVQSKLILWVIMTLTYFVFHFGADFTFQFAWIGQQET